MTSGKISISCSEIANRSDILTSAAKNKKTLACFSLPQLVALGKRNDTFIYFLSQGNALWLKEDTGQDTAALILLSWCMTCFISMVFTHSDFDCWVVGWGTWGELRRKEEQTLKEVTHLAVANHQVNIIIPYRNINVILVFRTLVHSTKQLSNANLTHLPPKDAHPWARFTKMRTHKDIGVVGLVEFGYCFTTCNTKGSMGQVGEAKVCRKCNCRVFSFDLLQQIEASIGAYASFHFISIFFLHGSLRTRGVLAQTLGAICPGECRMR